MMWRTTYGNLVTGRTVAQPDAVLTILRRYGIEPAKPVIECKGLLKRPGNAPSWVVVRKQNAPIPVGLAGEFADMYVNGAMLIVQLRAG